MEHLHKLISLREASNISGYNPDYLSSLIRSGKIYGKKIGKSWLTTEDDIRKYLRANGNQGRIFRAKFPRVAKVGALLLAVAAFVAVTVLGFYAAVYQRGYDQAKNTANTNQPFQTLDTDPLRY